MRELILLIKFYDIISLLLYPTVKEYYLSSLITIVVLSECRVKSQNYFLAIKGLSNSQDAVSILFYLSIVSLFYLFSLSFLPEHEILAQNQSLNMTAISNQSVIQPSLFDSNLKIEEVAKGFDFPTSMAFLGKDGSFIVTK
jgi:hypothetical protein